MPLENEPEDEQEVTLANAVPCPMCQSERKVTYRIGATRKWAARYRSKVVVCPVCEGQGWWPHGAYLKLVLPVTDP